MTVEAFSAPTSYPACWRTSDEKNRHPRRAPVHLPGTVEGTNLGCHPEMLRPELEQIEGFVDNIRYRGPHPRGMDSVPFDLA